MLVGPDKHVSKAVVGLAGPPAVSLKIFRKCLGTD
jgi:hypothetical protein